jgi:hypothetical protein
MPGFGSQTSDTAMTRYRRTRLIVDIDDPLQIRPMQGIVRSGEQVARASQVGVGSSTNVTMQRGGSWSLTPIQHDPSKIHERSDPDWIKGILDYLKGHWNLAPGFYQSNLWHSPADELRGVTVGPDVPSAGDPFIRKRVPQGQAKGWGGGLDEGSWPKPLMESENVRMQRVGESTITFPEETGLHARVRAPATHLHVPDAWWRMYFGGFTGPATDGGGAFALSFLGSGIALLDERVVRAGQAIWNRVKEFTYAPPGQVAGKTHAITIDPRPRGGMNFLVVGGSRVQAPARNSRGANFLSVPPPSPHVESFQVTPLVSGYAPRAFTTGAGPVRIDQREDQRPHWQVSRLVYPPSGTIEDHLFLLPIPCPAGAKITLVVRSDRFPAGNTAASNPDGTAWPAGTHAIEAELRDGTTRAPLQPHSAGHQPEKLIWNYATNADQQRYYARITLNGDTYSTPTVEGFHAEVEPQTIDRAGAKIAADVIEVSIVGPDRDPDHESMHVTVQDVTHQLGVLELRSRVHCRLDTQYDPANPNLRVVLFEGETASAEGEKRGSTDFEGFSGQSGTPIAYPSPDWYEWQIELIGMWGRLKDQIVMMGKDFRSDEQAPKDAQGRPQGWRITDVIKWFFTNVLGEPASRLDIPDLPIRLSGTKYAGDTYVLPTADPLAFISRLAHDYLAMFLLYDPNAGTNGGMWRLRYQTTPGAAPVWAFVLQQQRGKVPQFEESYPAGVTFVRRGHYRKRVKPPEFNYAVVTTMGQVLPEGAGDSKVAQFGWNPLSFDLFPDHPTADPNSPDYLGRFAPVVVYEPTLSTAEGETDVTQGVLSAYLDRLMQFGSHAQTWRTMTTPLVTFTDYADTQLMAGTGRRMLRHQDPILIAEGIDSGGNLINPQSFVVWDVHPTYNRDEGGDDYQWQVITCVNFPPEF